MARSTLSIRYLGTADQMPLDLFFSPRRFVRHTFTPGSSHDVTSICTADELNSSAQFVALVDAGLFSVTTVAGNDVAPLVAGAAAPSLAGVAVPQVLRFVLATGGSAGTADDVTLYTAAAPFAMRIVDAWMLVVQDGSGDTVQIRTEAADAGTALTAVITCTVAGLNRMAGATPTVTTTIAKNASLFARRADRSVTGELFLLVLPV